MPPIQSFFSTQKGSVVSLYFLPVDDDDDDDDNDDDDPMDEDGADDDDDDDDAQSCSNLDYDFERGAELENSLLRLRHQWELKDQKRRGDLGEPVAPEEPPPAAKPQPSGGKSKKEAARQQKRETCIATECVRGSA